MSARRLTRSLIHAGTEAGEAAVNSAVTIAARLPIFVVTAAFIGLLVSFPFATLALGTLVYLGSIPFGVARYRQLGRAEAEALRTEPIADPMEPPPSA